jgi:hypothetical protein
MPHSPAILALFGGLHAPELMVVFVLLVLLLGGRTVAIGGGWQEEDRRLNRREVRILLSVGAAVAIGIGLIVSQRLAR